MTTNLDRAREEAGRHHTPGGYSTADSPDGRTVPSILAGILDALIAIAERLDAPAFPVEPGACWHDSGVEWPDGTTPRCELKAGHVGAHEWQRPSGGTATWLETAPTTPTAEDDGRARVDATETDRDEEAS